MTNFILTKTNCKKNHHIIIRRIFGSCRGNSRAAKLKMSLLFFFFSPQGREARKQKKEMEEAARRGRRQGKQEQTLFKRPAGETKTAKRVPSYYPTTNAGVQNGSSAGTHTHVACTLSRARHRFACSVGA